MKKKLITITDHQTAAVQLRTMYYQVLSLIEDLQFVGKRNRLITALMKAAKRLLALRSDMENLYLNDYHENAYQVSYFPGPSPVLGQKNEPKTVRFGKGCNWNEVGTLIQSMISELVVFHNAYLSSFPVKSASSKSSNTSMRALEDARGAASSIQLREGIR